MNIAPTYIGCTKRDIQVGELRFTQDWVSQHIPAWKLLNECIAGREKFLEIGSFEGHSTCWFLHNFLSPTGTMFCVDPWQEYPELKQFDVEEAYQLFCRNIALATGPSQAVVVIKKTAVRGLSELIQSGHEETFDFAYVDGSHAAPDVLSDACMAWPLLKLGGIMLFDDYLFNINWPVEERTKCAIDAFTMLFGQKIQTVIVGDQYAVRKIRA